MRVAVRASVFLLAAGLALPAALMGESPAPVSSAPAPQSNLSSPGTQVPGIPHAPLDSSRSTSGTGVADTLSRSKSRADTVLVVKHRFNHREQIITGSVVMTCLAAMMVVMNNYNPR